MTWTFRSLMPLAELVSVTASWMPRSVEVPKVASVPVIEPTSPTTMGPFASLAAMPLPCSFLQPAVIKIDAQRRRVRRMGDSDRL
jgi:hypothetical protein